MLKKQKEWCEEKMEKGMEWVKKNKVSIAFGLGMTAMTGIYLIGKKIDEPKKGTICFTMDLNTEHVMSDVFYLNRFGKKKHMIAIDYGKQKQSDKNLKVLCDQLNEIVYPGN